MASARVASPPKSSYLGSRVSPTRTSRVTSSTGRSEAGRYEQSLSSSSTTGLFSRSLFFLLDSESSPGFPFCEEAYRARSRIRWPPWPHRLDEGRPKVSSIIV